MPALSNAKHEIFAQHVANGNEIRAAYTLAGYKPNRGNPSTLKSRKDVESRIAELLEERAQKSIQQYGAEIEYSRERLLGYLEEAREIAKDKDNPVGVTQATVAMARILGLIIDRREVGDAGAFDAMTDEELVREATKKAQELGVPHLKLVDDKDESAA
jgi:hypothetical protein